MQRLTEFLKGTAYQSPMGEKADPDTKGTP